MGSTVRRLLGLLILAVIVAVCSAGDAQVEIYKDLQIRSAERIIDLTSQLARHSVQLTVANNGNKIVSHFFVTIDENQASHLALIEAKSESGNKLAVTPAHIAATKGKKFQYYQVELGSNLAAQETANVVLGIIFAHTMRPQPAEIAQNEPRQLVIFEDNVFFTSPYQVASQKTSVKLAAPHVVDATEYKPNSVKGNALVYGSYQDRAAFDFHPLRVHFENNQPFLTVTRLTKVVEVSHWGNVNVEETYDMRHDGAKLRGEFSRFDYRRASKGPHIPSVTHVIPADARDIYYRDEIGNISTSNIEATEANLLLELVPRFPLFGGWKTQFYMGYDLPLSNYLFTDARDSSHFVLNVSFAKQFNFDVVVDEFEFRVILPEGAKDIVPHLPFSVDSKAAETHFTYLDTYGRPVLVLRKKNVVPEHNQFVQVSYRFSRSTMFQEPLMLVATYFFLFVLAMVYVRFSLNISPEQASSKVTEQ
eukprot:TRINITY_DN2569_c0_g1_i1.p1 TRINITY_DN2569_c0_g1~~TRINITY_DN2569_c0_g1_i1.p1  ORF type:complete len:494 (-),score=72.63 TRINITY_DN2569_c0_g1_i1:95-1525(-)